MADAQQRNVNGPSSETDISGDPLPTADTRRVTQRLEALLKLLSPEAPEAQGLSDALASIRTLHDDADSVRQRYEGLINAVPDAVTLLDLEGNILEANDAACRIYGYRRQQLTRMSVRDLNPELPPDRMEEVERSYHVGETFTVETTNRRGDGTRFPVEVHSSVFLDRNERRVVAVARDISKRREAEQGLRASEARFRLLLQAMDKGLIVQDASGRITAANPAACRILGFSETQLLNLGASFKGWQIVDEGGRNLSFLDLPGNRAMRERRTIESTLLGIYHNEQRRYSWLNVTAVPQYLDGDPRPFQTVSTFSDVTDLKRDSQLFAQTQALAQIGGWQWDPLGDRLYWTDELYRMMQRTPGSAVSMRDFILHVAVPDRPRLQAILEEAQSRGGAFDVECRFNTALGETRWARLLGEGVLRKGEPFRVTGTLQDVTAAKLQEEDLRRRARSDPLTGLANRDAALAQLQAAVEQADDSSGPVVYYVDLDRFKVVNELIGHPAGDSLLRAAARRLQACVGDSGLVARFGGDEFLVLVPHCAADASDDELAERITADFAHAFGFGGEEFTITASVGIARHPQDGSTAQQLVNNADAAMHDAKRRGRNTWQQFNPTLARALSDRLVVETQLRRALENNEFHLVYQPQVRLVSGAPVSAEALLRWRNRTLGDLAPDRFIHLAENSGDIVRIGAWVVREACRQMRAWRDARIPLERVAVNVSFRQFLGEDLPDIVIAALHEFDLPGEALELEITERVLIEDVPDTDSTFAALKRLGVKVTIDDFGEGYSALNYLRRLPIDGLKISHSFLAGVPDNPSDAAICQAIIRIAQSLGLTVIAEGVETEKQREYLLRLGTEIGQGFLFSPAVTADEFARYVRQNTG